MVQYILIINFKFLKEVSRVCYRLMAHPLIYDTTFCLPKNKQVVHCYYRLNIPSIRIVGQPHGRNHCKMYGFLGEKCALNVRNVSFLSTFRTFKAHFFVYILFNHKSMNLS